MGEEIRKSDTAKTRGTNTETGATTIISPLLDYRAS
jgi:hypothetical protein